MIDREKLVKGFECCADMQRNSMNRSCDVCPYNDDPSNGTCITLFPLFRDAIVLLKADQAYLLGGDVRTSADRDDADLYGEHIAAAEVRRLIDQMRNVSLRWTQEKAERDCRDCVEWETCPVGKGAHERGASIDYSAGECPDFRRVDE